MPHLDAAFNLARWLTRNDHDAEDVVQQAYLRAFQSWATFHGGDGRAWLLTIVRNTCFTWLTKNRAHQADLPFDDDLQVAASESQNPEALLLQNADREMLRQAIDQLPPEFREVIVLREMEGLSYKEVAGVAGVPVGTVMSRLSRARNQLEQLLLASAER